MPALLILMALACAGLDTPDEAFAKAEGYARKLQFKGAQVAYTRLARAHPETAAGRLAAQRSQPSAFLGWDWVLHNGDSANRIDIVLMGEGYQLGEMKGFVKLAEDVPGFFARNRLLGAYSTYFNFVRADLVSADNGVDGFGRDYDTALNGRTLNTNAGHVGIDTKAAWDMLRQLPEHDGQAIVFVRNGVLGTGGGGIATIGGKNIKTAVHEFGHSFGGLGDEYATETHKRGSPRRGINVTNDGDPKKAPWAHFIEAKIRRVGMYEGASGQVRGAWKPTSSGCIMESGEFFCPVCTEALILRMYSVLDPIDASSPVAHPRQSKKELVLTADGLEFSVQPLRPTTHQLDVDWYVLPEREAPLGAPNPDRASARRYTKKQAGQRRQPGRLPLMKTKPWRAKRSARTGASVLKLKLSKLEPGRYRVICRVKDSTQPRGERKPLVIKDSGGLLESERAWWVRVPEE
ncbi:MAG: M64 family metallo-endopeptidase [Planctomycetota bacterium]|nr:M64 family metallo-endopeptidase [Planctomycetota bacterium]